HHTDDVGTHSIKSLHFCKSKDAIVRLAALLHDIGKATTYAKDEKTEIITFYDHEHVGAELSSEIADRLRLSKKDKQKLVLLVKEHMFSVTEDQTDKAIRRFIRKVGLENIEDMLVLRTADRLGSGATETSWRTDLFKKRIIDVQNVPFSIKDMKISGLDVMKELDLKPGPEVGKILSDLFEKVDNGDVKNEREELLKSLITNH
ncbi:MAG: HD domain-containing protein, partial [Candidatus Roizmanbacteria bacterium]